MDLRIVGACAAVGGGALALVALAIVAVAPTSVAPTAPSDPVLVAEGDASDNVSGLTTHVRLRARVPASAIPDVAILTPPGATPSPPGATPSLQDPTPSLRDSTPIPRANAPTKPSDPGKIVETPSAAPPDAPPADVRKQKPPRPAVDHKYDGVFTMDEIRKLKTAMHLSPDQEPYWPPVASLLRELGRQQMAQVDAGQKKDLDLGMDMMQRFYTSASPLLQSLREDQKVQIRRLAKDMGFGAYASYI